MEPGKFGENMPTAIVAPKSVPMPATSNDFPRGKDDKVPEGTVVAAVVAPATGPIDHAPGTPVVTVVQKFWASPTIKAARNLVVAAFAAVLVVLCTTALTTWSAGKSILTPGAVDWRATEIACEIAGGTVFASAFLAWARKRDNNPVQ